MYIDLTIQTILMIMLFMDIKRVFDTITVAKNKSATDRKINTKLMQSKEMSPKSIYRSYSLQLKTNCKIFHIFLVAKKQVFALIISNESNLLGLF